MKKFTILFSLLLISNYAFSQPFLTGHKTIVYQDASRSNRNINAEIYYPADVAGNNVAVAAAGGQFPVVVFGHGFVMTWSAYDNLWVPLTQAGFIVVFPTTEDGFAPVHTEFGKDIAFLVTALQNEGLVNSSIFFNRVAATSAVMGHSMGGGSSFLAVQYNPNITAIANLAAAETNPSAIAAAANINIPALVIAGANDCITPPAANQLAMYNAMPSNCKTYISITGASHCQFANSNFNCTFGELTCTPTAAITRAVQHGIVNQLLIPWLNFELKNDCNAGLDFELLVTNPTTFTVQKNCIFCTVGINENGSINPGFEIYPTIVHDFLNISPTLKPLKNAEISIVDAQGKLVCNRKLNIDQNEISKVSMEIIPAGIYFIKISGNDINPIIRKIIKL
jgi:pimeloyl-ACP methyl ester carboxylesterase